MTDEMAVDLGGLGDSLSVCDSRGAPCALTSPRAVIEFTILRHSSPSMCGSKINKWWNHEIPTATQYICNSPGYIHQHIPGKITWERIFFFYDLFHFTLNAHTSA